MMTDQEQKDRFVEALKKLGGSAGNGRLREALRWDEQTYAAIKASLIHQGVVAPGRGRGGSVALTDHQGGTAQELGELFPDEALSNGGRRAAKRPTPTDGNGVDGGPKWRTAAAMTKPPRSPQGASFQQAFRNIDDALRKEAGCTTELDYTEQTSWLLFLKYLDDLEQDKAMEAALDGKAYTFILDESYRWDSWAAPKTQTGTIDHNRALTGDDLCDFVDDQLFPYLEGFKQRASGPATLEYKIGEIFGEIGNKIRSGYNLREIIDHIDELHFRSQTEKHELSVLYEEKIKRMGNAGRNGGEYYTPRPLIRAMVRVVKPEIGERIYDGACGSAGFLCEAFDYLKAKSGLTTGDLRTLQERTFYGKEKKSLAYVMAIMNMILHGIEAPSILHTNTLAENIADIQEKDRFDIALANPPFGGQERREVQQNFPIRTGETAYLFLQHFIRILKPGGRAGIVIKNTFLSNSDNASVSLRKLLLESCNLHTVLDCPGGTFQGAGVKTVVLFFEKGAPTRKTWFYQLDPGRTLGKTNPLNDNDLAECVTLQKTFADSLKSWTVDAGTIDQATFDLSVRNPNGGEDITHRSPQEIMDEIAALDAESAGVLAKIRAIL